MSVIQNDAKKLLNFSKTNKYMLVALGLGIGLCYILKKRY